MGNISIKSLEPTYQHRCKAMFSDNKQENREEEEEKHAGQIAAERTFPEIE